MPFKGFKCHCGKNSTYGPTRDVSVEEALECSGSRHNPCDWTYELLASLVSCQQDRNYISTTMLTGKCLRQKSLEKKYDFFVEPQRQWAAFRGTMYHGQLENFAHPSSIAEARFHVELDGYGHLSGSPDLYDPRYGVLWDYKTNETNPKYSSPWKDHIAQVQINRWLIDHAQSVDWQGVTYGLDEKENRDFFVPKQWDRLVLLYMDGERPKPLTVSHKEKVVYKNGNEGSRNVPDIWSDEQVEEYILAEYPLAQQAMSGGETPPIPPAFEMWKHPLCNYCAVKDRCVEEYITGVKEEHHRTQQAQEQALHVRRRDEVASTPA